MDYSKKVARSYKTQSIETASPGKLVLMLFDGALRFMDAAKKGFEEEDFTKRNEDVNNNLIRAQNIVMELQGSLDMSVKGDLPGTLYRLYDFVVYQLQQANLKKDSKPIAHAYKTISELREAWEEMLSQDQEGIAGEPGSISMKA
ncbi:MAG: flagellar export chaperone FliS [Opitutales bacterium]